MLVLADPEERRDVEVVHLPGGVDHPELDVVPADLPVRVVGAPVLEQPPTSVDLQPLRVGQQEAAPAGVVEPDHQLGAVRVPAGHGVRAEPDVVGGVPGAGRGLTGVPGAVQLTDRPGLHRQDVVGGADVPDATAQDVRIGGDDAVRAGRLGRRPGHLERRAAGVADAALPGAPPVEVTDLVLLGRAGVVHEPVLVRIAQNLRDGRTGAGGRSQAGGDQHRAEQDPEDAGEGAPAVVWSHGGLRRVRPCRARDDAAAEQRCGRPRRPPRRLGTPCVSAARTPGCSSPARPVPTLSGIPQIGRRRRATSARRYAGSPSAPSASTPTRGREDQAAAVRAYRAERRPTRNRPPGGAARCPVPGRRRCGRSPGRRPSREGRRPVRRTSGDRRNR